MDSKSKIFFKYYIMKFENFVNLVKLKNLSKFDIFTNLKIMEYYEDLATLCNLKISWKLWNFKILKFIMVKKLEEHETRPS